MKRRSLLLALTLCAMLSALTTLARPALAQGKPGIERMYVLYCGDIHLNDASSFTPGASGPGHLSVTCYLIKHARGWVLFDTGVGDHIVKMPDGQKSQAGVWTVKKTLESQLAEIGLKPSDINYLALSHSHGDHVGNLKLFPQSTLVVQKAEWEWKPPVGPVVSQSGMKTITPDGDHDLFGDGSVMLIATHGHSPGHQNMLDQAAEDRRHHVHGQFRAHQSQLGQRPRAATQFQRAAVAGGARAHARRAQGGKRGALDRPRAERGGAAQICAGLL